MSELQKYMDAAKRMQTAEPGTIGWMTAANVFRDMPYTQIAALMIQVDAARSADNETMDCSTRIAVEQAEQCVKLKATIERMRRAIECLKSAQCNCCPHEVPAEFADLICAKREENDNG